MTGTPRRHQAESEAHSVASQRESVEPGIAPKRCAPAFSFISLIFASSALVLLLTAGGDLATRSALAQDQSISGQAQVFWGKTKFHEYPKGVQTS